MRKGILLLIIVFLISLVGAGTLYEGDFTGNYTFWNNSNYTNYLSVPLEEYYHSVSINITSYNRTGNFSLGNSYVDQSGVGLTYSVHENTWSATNGVDFTLEQDLPGNIYLEPKSKRTLFKAGTFTATENYDCANYSEDIYHSLSDNSVLLRLANGSYVPSVICLLIEDDTYLDNRTRVKLSINTTTGYPRINYSTYVYNLSIPIAPSSPWLEIGTPDGTHEWNYSGKMAHGTEETTTIEDSINSAINGGACDCEGCFISNGNCSIPFLFHSDTTGTIEQSEFSVTDPLFYTCSEGNGTSFIRINLTLRDEINGTNLSGDVIGNFVFWGNSINYNYTYNHSDIGISSSFICSDNNKTLRTYGQVSYSGTGYDTREYYFINGTIDGFNDTAEEIDLYLLDSSLSSGVKFWVTDEADNPFEGYYIIVQRYDVATDSYKIVAMGKTDDDGNDFIYLRGYDTWYRFIIQEDTTNKFTSAIRKITTSNLYFTLTETTLTNYLDSFEGITYNLSFDNSTDTFTSTFSTGTGLSTKACLNVIKKTSSGDSWICQECLTASSGTLTCDIGTETGTFQAYFYAQENPQFLLDTLEYVRSIGSYREQLLAGIGLDGVIITLASVIFIITLVAFGGTANMVILFGLLSLALMGILGFLSLTLSMFMGLVIMGGIVIALIRR